VGESADSPVALHALGGGDPQRFLEILDALPAVVGAFRGPDHVVEFANPHYRRLVGGAPMVGRPLAELFDQPENRPFIDALDQVYETGEPVAGRAAPALIDGETVYYDFNFTPLRDAAGATQGVLVHASDVTAQVYAFQAAGANEVRYRTLVEANLMGVCVADEHTVVEANDAFLALAGRTRAELEAGEVDWRAMTPPEWAAADDLAVAQLHEVGRVESYEKELVRPNGTRTPVEQGAALLSREPFRAITFVYDLTERRTAEHEREQHFIRERGARRQAELAAGRIARLQRITASLSGAISADEVSELVVEAAVDALGAAAGVVALRDRDELLVRRHHGYAQADVEPWTRFPADAQVPLAEAIRDRELVLFESSGELAERYPDLAATAGGHEALVAVPFLFEGEAMGAMGLSFARPHAFTADERSFLLAMGRQCAQALERARLYEERAYVARTLQTGLLPERLADIPGVEVAVRYRSISDGGAVGGDFYDLFAVEDDRWVLAIGDVCGKGTAAAVLTGLARHTIRAIAMREQAPDAILTFLNEAMRRQVGDGSYCTVGCATITRHADGSVGACLASGGHPYPILLRPGEPIREIEVPGTLLGFVEDLELPSVPFDLGPGDTLVFYTDGVTDARGDGERFGDQRLLATLEAARGGSAEEVAEAVDEAVRRHQPDRPEDDRAVLVVRVAGGTSPAGA